MTITSNAGSDVAAVEMVSVTVDGVTSELDQVIARWSLPLA